MDHYLTYEQISQSAETVRSKIDSQPEVGIILGSGLGGLAESVKNARIVPYEEIPNWPVSTVEGHL